MKIINTEKEDYHLHSSNYSDGFNTVEEIVQFAGKIGMKKIVITDHSQASLDALNIIGKSGRWAVKRWENVHNKVDVLFGVEADLLNIKGDICSHIQNIEGDYIILSHHDDVFIGTQEQFTAGFIRAIEKHHDKINVIGHVCLSLEPKYAKKVILKANEYKIPLELNSRYFLKEPDRWIVLLENADRILINSDAHVLCEIKELRKKARKLLKTSKFKKYLNKK